MSDWAKWGACLLVFQRSNVGQDAVAELVILYAEWLALESSHDGKVSDNEQNWLSDETWEEVDVSSSLLVVRVFVLLCSVRLGGQDSCVFHE